MRDIASLIDHTLLRPDATRRELEKLCSEAKEYGFASVCVNPVNVEYCVNELKDAHIPVCTVVGFPLGASTTAVKVAEVNQAKRDGAKEFDMVMNIGALKDGNDEIVKNDIRRVVDATGGLTVKVIIEACLLTPGQKVRACKLAKEAGAHFVKTSTGFASGGATVEDVILMRKTVGSSMGVKAAGGIKTYRDAAAMVEAGANRIGASAGVAIVTEKDP